MKNFKISRGTWYQRRGSGEDFRKRDIKGSFVKNTF